MQSQRVDCRHLSSAGDRGQSKAHRASARSLYAVATTLLVALVGHRIIGPKRHHVPEWPLILRELPIPAGSVQQSTGGRRGTLTILHDHHCVQQTGFAADRSTVQLSTASFSSYTFPQDITTTHLWSSIEGSKAFYWISS